MAHNLGELLRAQNPLKSTTVKTKSKTDISENTLEFKPEIPDYVRSMVLRQLPDRYLADMKFGRHEIWPARDLAHTRFGRHKNWPTRHLSDTTFGRLEIWPTRHLADSKLGRYDIWPTRHLTDTKFGRHDI